MLIIEKQGRILSIYLGDWFIHDDKLYMEGHVVLSPVSKFGVHEVPDQDLSALYKDDGFGGLTIAGKWPDDIPLQYTEQELIKRTGLRIDRDTGKAIDEAMHPFVGIEEQIGILRAQIAEILNAIGLAPTADFDQLNTIATEKIKDGQIKKGAL